MRMTKQIRKNIKHEIFSKRSHLLYLPTFTEKKMMLISPYACVRCTKRNIRTPPLRFELQLTFVQNWKKIVDALGGEKRQRTWQKVNRDKNNLKSILFWIFFYFLGVVNSQFRPHFSHLNGPNRDQKGTEGLQKRSKKDKKRSKNNQKWT